MIVDTAKRPGSANKVVEPFGRQQERPRYSPLADGGASFKTNQSVFISFNSN